MDYALSWVPLETVLFVADVRINFDNFRQSMMATCDSKTVFTPNPGKFIHTFLQIRIFFYFPRTSSERNLKLFH